MTPSPGQVIEALSSAPAQWWEAFGALGPVAIRLDAIVAAVIGGFTLWQRANAEERSEWWRSAQWAPDRALDDRPSTKSLGLATLEVLARSKLAHAEELELFDIAWASVNDPDGEDGANGGTVGYLGPATSGPVVWSWTRAERMPRPDTRRPPSGRRFAGCMTGTLALKSPGAGSAAATAVDSGGTTELGIKQGGMAMSTNASVSKGDHDPRHARKVRSQEITPQERRVQVAAARLRLTLDGRLGRVTPDEVKALAKEPLQRLPTAEPPVQASPGTKFASDTKIR